MIILTQEDLRKSENPYIQELVKNNLIHATSGDGVAQILNDAHRGLLVNGKPIPEEYLSREKISDYIIQQLGEKYGNALLTCYSQNPAYTAPQSLGLTAMVNGETDYIISPTHSNTTINIYADNEQLHYSVRLTDMKCNHPESKLLPGLDFPGTVSSDSVYDDKAKAFITQKITCSNHVLEDMFIKHSFHGKQSIEQAAREEQETITATIATTTQIIDLMERITKARKTIAPHNPHIPGAYAKHPITALDDSLSTAFFLLSQHDKHPNPSDLLASQKQACQNALNKAAHNISFITGKRLLNTIAHILNFKPPFKDLKVYDDARTASLSNSPIISGPRR